MSKTPASKSTRNKGTIDGAWSLGKQKESPPKTHEDPEEDTLKKAELVALLKDFQLDLKNTLKEEIATLRDDFQKQLDSMGAAVQLVEERASNCETAVQSSTDMLKNLQEEISEVKKQNEFLFSKCEDLENRDRRRNIRLRGVPESTEGQNMVDWAIEFLHDLQPELSKDDLALERAHRVGPMLKGKDRRPRDILIKFYNFQAKEKILQTARNVDHVYCGEQVILIFQDIAQSTLQRRAGMRPLTVALRDKGIKYRWTYPFGLAFEWNKKQRMITSMEEGRKFLPEEMWGKKDDSTMQGRRPSEGIPWPWTTVESKRPRARKSIVMNQTEEGEVSDV